MTLRRHEAANSPRVKPRVADRGLPAVTMPSWAISQNPARADEHRRAAEGSTTVCSNEASHGLRGEEIGIANIDRDGFSPSLSNTYSWRMPLCMLLSVLMHGGVFWYALLHFDASIGAGGSSLEAISVEIVDASALESIEINPSVQSGGVAQPVSTRAGAEAPVDQAEVQQQTESNKAILSSAEEALIKPEPQSVPEPELRAADNVTQRQNSVVAEVEAPPDTQEKALPDDIEREKGEAQVRQTAQDALMAGQTASRGAETSEAAMAAAQATRGQAARYAMLVRATLGNARPAHFGKRGRVIVRFVIDEAGTVSIAAVTTSSGSKALDEATLSSLRKASFPKPPPELSEGQRQFLVPFDFK